MKNYFSEKELKCPCCGRNDFKDSTLLKLNQLREAIGLPITVNSGFRCEKYNTLKGYTQTHATGQAVDLACSHKLAAMIVNLASGFGFTGLGIKQKGDNRFIHLDDLPEADRRPRPHVWSY